MLVVLSLSLAVVLLQLTYTFANGFDMDKYLRSWVVSDFILSDARYFQISSIFSPDSALPEESISRVEAQCSVRDSACVYGNVNAQEWVTEDWFRKFHGRHNSQDTIDIWLKDMERNDQGLVISSVSLYGMERFAHDQGDLSALYDPSQNAIAAVYFTDDYGKPEQNTNWVKPSDQMTIQYMDEWEFFDTRTGEAVDAEYANNDYVSNQAKKYRDITYTVAASITFKKIRDKVYY